MNKNVEEFEAFKRGDIRMPSHLKVKKEEKGKLYKNKFIEFLSKAPFGVPHTMWVIVALLFIWFSIARADLSLITTVWVCIAGALTWTFAEYVIHRFMYHTETNSKNVLDFQMGMHGYHHNYPKDPERLAMPPIPGLALGALFFGFFYIIMGVYAVAFFPGFMLGYDAYITIHYYQHRIKSPKYKPWKNLWQHHKAHHYSNPYSAFGVSTRLWDLIFGTMPKASNKKRQVEEKAA
jgi:sterol desaturase/sphingolipid hydroxylase (fatty acid hydroxylase superfamily)